MARNMTPVSQAVIVAAGESSRLRPLTNNLPKCLLEVGGETILSRSIRSLRTAGIDRIAIVVGFESRKIIDAASQKDVTFLLNPFYAVSNNLGSLWFAKDWVDGAGFVYLHADVVYDTQLLGQVTD